MKLKTEVVVIGAGSGGYVAAIKLGRMGKKVVLVERDGMEGLGGICMNHGCISSKALIVASKFFRDIKTAGEMGIIVSDVSIDMGKLQTWKDDIVKKLRLGIDFLLKTSNVKWIQGSASFLSSNTVKITGNSDVDSIDFDNAIIATGALPNSLPELSFDGQSIISYNEALDLKEIPKDLLVVGGGYIAVELGTCYAKLGSNVKIIYRRDRLLREYDDDVINVFQKRMLEDGIELVFNSTISRVEKSENGRLMAYVNSADKGESVFEADKILCAVGVIPNSKSLGLENTKVKTDEGGFISVDEQLRTSDPKIFAIGDVARKPMLAHKATREGKIVADVIAGKNVKFENICIPNVIFSDPEFAIAGITEKKARESGIEINIGKFPFSALGRARIERETKGFVKIIEEKKSGKILGVIIIGIDASNMISEAALAIEKGLRTEDLMNTIHPHPTLPESIMEAAEDVRKASIHIAQL